MAKSDRHLRQNSNDCLSSAGLESKVPEFLVNGALYFSVYVHERHLSNLADHFLAILKELLLQDTSVLLLAHLIKNNNLTETSLILSHNQTNTRL